MIPKIIHYCWFGNNEKSELILFCISSWKKYMPDYKIIEWNESNFDFEICQYVKEAYHEKKWAFVSDYVRAYALFNYGGIYLDTDVEIKRNVDVFLSHGAFSGFEAKHFPFTALWGSEKWHNWPKKVLDYYHQQKKFTLLTNTMIVSDILINVYGVNETEDKTQHLADNIVIYPSSHFCLDLPINYASHHFNGSWLDTTKNSYKKSVYDDFIKREFYRINENPFAILHELTTDKVISFQIIMSYVLKKIKKKLLW